MPGRFALALPRRRVAEALGLGALPGAPDRYNIGPGQLVEAVYADRHVTRRLPGLFRWGLVPAWAKDPKIGARLVNARVETVFDKPSFRAAIRYRRCLIPAQGFYAWRQGQPGPKQPYFLTSTDDAVLILAGIFEHATLPGGVVIDSLAILSREATGLVRLLHDREPVLLPPDRRTDWIDPLRTSRREVEEMLDVPAPPLTAVPVGTLVNNAGYDGPELVTPIGSPLPAEAAGAETFRPSDGAS